MSQNSKIEWTDATWNPITGCTAISDGCKNCYAKRIYERFNNEPFSTIRFHEDRLKVPLHWRKPRRIFVNSMGDLFHESVPFDFIDRALAIMAMCPQHTFMALTKRPGRMVEYFTDTGLGLRIGAHLMKFGRGNVGAECAVIDIAHKLTFGGLKNLMLGCTVENQAAADERIPLLLATPAAKRFVSCEPLLGAVDLSDFAQCEDCGKLVRDYGPNTPDIDPTTGIDQMAAELIGRCGYCHSPFKEPDEVEFALNLDLVIAGGETGPGARPAHPDWFRGLRDACQEASIPYFFKSFGDWGPVGDSTGKGIIVCSPEHGSRWGSFQADGTFIKGLFKVGCQHMLRVGKSRAGRMLDGREHNDMPGSPGGCE